MKASVLMGASVLSLAFASTAFAETRTVKVTNKDRDPDRAVSTTHTTSAVTSDRRDVVESRAEERREVEGDHWTVAPLLGGATNGYGVGIGARAGYTFATPVYLGANFMYQTGGGDSRATAAYYPSAEIGYDIGVGPLLLRPYGGVGALLRNGGGNDTGLVYPGFTMHYLIAKSPAFVGADARVLLPFEGTAAFSAEGTTGVNF